MLSIVTMTVGNLAALTQTNIKRMLAYSSIAHAGYLLMGVVAGTARGVTAMLIYLLIYTFMQLGAFAVIVMLRRRDVVGDELKDFSGLAFRQPFAAFAMLLFMLSLGGIPPTAGFMGKFWLFGAAIDSRLLLAGGHRRAEQRDLALLLHPARRLHVSEEGDDRARSRRRTPALTFALARRRRGDARARRLPAVCCSKWRKRRRARSVAGAAAC